MNSHLDVDARSLLHRVLGLFEAGRMPMVLLVLVASFFFLRAAIRGGFRLFWTLFGLAMAWKFAGGAFLRHWF